MTSEKSRKDLRVCGVCYVMGSGLACLRTGTARVASIALGAGMIIGALGATKTSISAVILVMCSVSTNGERASLVNLKFTIGSLLECC